MNTQVRLSENIELISPEMTPAIETLYARLLRMNLKHIAICSPNRACGNSTLAWLLARRAAMAGQQVLLIDFNLQSPTLHRLARCERPEWLPLDDSWQNAVQHCEALESLSLLTCPEEFSHHIEFHNPVTLQTFFESCRTRYDLVLCDLPPLLNPQEESIPADILCAASQGTLLNITSGITTESEADEVRDILRQSGAHLSAVVMNDRFTPGLKQELIRETYRLERIFPRWMPRLRKRLDKMTLLNQDL